MDDLFPIGNETLFLSLHCTHFVLPSGLLLSIHNEWFGTILDSYENELIWITLFSFHFLLKGTNSFSKLLIYFKHNHVNTAKNTVISPNFLVWKFCGNAQFPHQEIRWNYGPRQETCIGETKKMDVMVTQWKDKSDSPL